MRPVNNATWVGNLIIVFALLLLYSVTAFFSPGYDDEFHNIRWAMQAAEAGGRLQDFWHFANIDNAHPPGSYLISFGLFSLIGDWSLVRVVKTVLFLGAVTYAIVRIFDVRPQHFWIFALVVLASPSLLIWGTGLRWFAEFTAILLLVVALTKTNQKPSVVFWSLFFLLVTLLLYINYLGIILAPLLIALAFLSRWHETLQKPLRFFIPAAVCVAVFIPEFFNFLSALGSSEGQRGSLLMSVLGVTHGLSVNHGIFPLSLTGGVALISGSLLIAIIFWFSFPSVFREAMFWFVAVSVIVIILSGVSVKFRNVTPLIPLFLGIWVYLALKNDVLAKTGRGGFLFLLFFVLFVLTQAIGVRKVVLHQNTAKGDWNLPISDVRQAISEAPCDNENIFFASSNAVFHYHAWELGVGVLGIGRSDDASFIFENDSCLIVAKTFRGSTPQADYLRAFDLAGLELYISEKSFLRRDPYASIKRRFDADIPDYYVEIIVYGRIPAGWEIEGWEEIAIYQRRNLVR